MSDEPEDKPPTIPPVEVQPTMEVGLIEDPDMFEIGLANQVGNAPMIAFLKDGKPSHAIAFIGEAGEKLLLSMLALIDLLHGIGEQAPKTFVMPEAKDKKKQTLH